MNTRYGLIEMGIAAMLMVSTIGVAHANLITNPSFESPNIPGGTFAIFGAIPGWTSSFGGGIEIQDNVAGSPFAGAQHVELDSTSNSNMLQSIATVAGAAYDLSFAYSPRPGVSAASNGIDVLWDGGPLVSLAVSGIGLGNTAWVVHNFMVTASGALTNLEFRATGPSDSLGGYLDAVILTEKIPEPGTLAIFGLGLAGLGAMRRRKAA